MNTITATGWLQKDGWTATQPKSGHQILCFDVMLANDESDPAPWRCEVENETVRLRVESKLVAGAGVIIRGELRARPFTRHGVHEGFSRYLLVDRVEFSRVPTHAEPATADTSSP